jgi:hypothetical protein
VVEDLEVNPHWDRPEDTPVITVERPPVPVRRKAAARRSSYVTTIIVNLVMIYVVNHLLEWGLLPFLTEEFTRVLWLINLSLGAGILVNLAWLSYDPDWFGAVGRIGLNAISLVVSLRMYQVFPFDFSPYALGWGTVARVVLILTMVAVAMAMVVELGRLIRLATRL